MKSVTTLFLGLFLLAIIPTQALAQRHGGSMGGSHGTGWGLNSRGMGSGHQMGGWQNRNTHDWGSMNRGQMGRSGHDQMGNHDRDRHHEMDRNRQHSGHGHDGNHQGDTGHGNHGNDWWSQSW